MADRMDAPPIGVPLTQLTLLREYTEMSIPGLTAPRPDPSASPIRYKLTAVTSNSGIKFD